MRAPNRLRRFLALTLTLLIVLPLSLLAARWQWNRHIERETRNGLIAAAETRPAVPIAELAPTGELRATDEWRLVSMQGRFTTVQPTLWRKQPLDGQPGFIALARFAPADSPAVIVELGWVAADGRSPARPIPALETANPVQLTGYLRLLPDCESSDPSDIPNGQTNCPLTLLQNSDAQLLLQSATAPAPLTALGLPELDAGPHLGYVGQWLLIGLTAIITYVSLIRRLDEGPVTPAK